MIKMQKRIKKITKSIINLWNIYGGIILSYLFAKYMNFDKSSMDIMTSYLIMNLAFISTLTLIKCNLSNKKTENLLDKALMYSQNSVRLMQIATNPNEKIKELGNTIEETQKIIGKVENNMWKNIKNVLNWIKTYWQQIVGLVSTFAVACVTVYAFIFDKFGWLLQYFPEGETWEIAIKISVGIFAVIGVIFMVRNQVKWVGIGSITTAQEYLESLSKTVEGELSDKAKLQVKASIKTLKTNLKGLEKEYDVIYSTFKNIDGQLSVQNELLKLGAGDMNTVKELTIEKSKLQGELNQISAKIENAQNSIEKYSNVLAVKHE